MLILTQLKKGCQEKIEQIFEKSIDKHLFEYYTKYKKTNKCSHIIIIVWRSDMRTITKKKFYLIMTAVFAIVIVIMLGVKFVDASDSANTPKYKYYTSYKVQKNDTLTSIAEEYTKGTDVSISDYISELKNDNRLNDDEITEGKSIIISYYSDIKK